MTNFNKDVNRKGTYCTQWDFASDRFGLSDVLPFSISDMDLEYPKELGDALKGRLEHNILGYSRWQHADYLNAISSWYGVRYGAIVNSSWITYSPSVMYSIAKYIEIVSLPGESVLIFTPVYNAFFDVIDNSDRDITSSSLIYTDGLYSIDWDDFSSKAKECSAVLLCNPHNPVGRCWSEYEINRIADICKQNNCWLLSDEIHSDFIFSGKFYSAINLEHENVVVFNSISKTFNVPALTGSYVISSNAEVNDSFRKISRYRDFVNSPSILNVIATIVAYTKCAYWVDALNDHILSNKKFVFNYILSQLPSLKITNQEACYFAWIDCRSLGISMGVLQHTLVEREKVGIMSGAIYGPESESFLRLNLACPKSKLVDGLRRLKRAINFLQGN